MSDFKWNMTESDFQGYNETFGTLSFGKYEIEFHRTLDNSLWYGYTEVYEKTDSNRSDMITSLGTELPLLDNDVYLSFNSFKNTVQEEFLTTLINKDILKDDLQMLELVLANANNGICVKMAEKGLALDRLSKHESSYVRHAVVQHCDGNAEMLTKLASDEIPSVRRAVARYCNGNEAILDLLKNDDDMYVRAEVAKQGYNLENYVNDESPLVRIVVAKCDKTDPELLVYLANDENWEARESVAARGIALDVLVNDPDDDVRCAALYYIVKNYSNYEDTLQNFLNDPSEKVRATIARMGYGLDILAKDPAEGVSNVAKDVIKQQNELMSHEPIITDCVENVLDPTTTTQNFYGMTYNALYTVNIGKCDGYNEFQVEMIGKSYHSGKEAVAYITNPSNFAVSTEDKNHVLPLPKEFVNKLEHFIEEQAMNADKAQSKSNHKQQKQTKTETERE